MRWAVAVMRRRLSHRRQSDVLLLWLLVLLVLFGCVEIIFLEFRALPSVRLSGINLHFFCFD
jgi:hypothetical protein